MRKKSKPSKALPLSNIRVLVGRARHQAGALSAELRKLGADVIEIPFIEIRKPKSFAPLDAALRNLHAYDWLILTSVNGVEAMWARMEKLKLDGTGPREGQRSIYVVSKDREGHEFTFEPALSERSEPKGAAGGANLVAASAAAGLRVAAIGPATKKAIEQRGCRVDVVPKEYVAESVVRSLCRRVKGKRVLLVRAKVARDVIPRELRAAGAQVDVVEAYETVVPEASRRRLQAVLKSQRRHPQVITFTSSSTVRNFVGLLGGLRAARRALHAVDGQSLPRACRGECPHTPIQMASIGPVTSATLIEMGLPADISAKEFTIPGLVDAIVRWRTAHRESTT
jgi:uroporphyrinogen-III synthase